MRAQREARAGTNLMVNFNWPTQKGTELLPGKPTNPASVVTEIVSSGEGNDQADFVAAQKILVEHEGRINQFVQAQRQGYNLSNNQLATNKNVHPDIDIRYTNQFGTESVFLQVYPRPPGGEEVEKKLPILCLLVLYEDNKIAAFDMAVLGASDLSKLAPIYTAKLKKSDWSGWHEPDNRYVTTMQMQPTKKSPGIIYSFISLKKNVLSLDPGGYYHLLNSNLNHDSVESQDNLKDFAVLNGDGSTIYTTFAVFAIDSKQKITFSQNVYDPTRQENPYAVSSSGEYFFYGRWAGDGSVGLFSPRPEATPDNPLNVGRSIFVHQHFTYSTSATIVACLSTSPGIPSCPPTPSNPFGFGSNNVKIAWQSYKLVQTVDQDVDGGYGPPSALAFYVLGGPGQPPTIVNLDSAPGGSRIHGSDGSVVVSGGGGTVSGAAPCYGYTSKSGFFERFDVNASATSVRTPASSGEFIIETASGSGPTEGPGSCDVGDIPYDFSDSNSVPQHTPNSSLAPSGTFIQNQVLSFVKTKGGVSGSCTYNPGCDNLTPTCYDGAALSPTYSTIVRKATITGNFARTGQGIYNGTTAPGISIYTFPAPIDTKTFYSANDKLYTPYGVFPEPSVPSITGFSGWLHVSNPKHYIQGFVINDDKKYLYLDGKDFTAPLARILKTDISKIRTMIMDIPLDAIKQLH